MKYLIILALSVFSLEKAFTQTIHLYNGKDLNNWYSDIPARDKDPNLRKSLLSETGIW
jgi:hypothetical protein